MAQSDLGKTFRWLLSLDERRENHRSSDTGYSAMYYLDMFGYIEDSIVALKAVNVDTKLSNLREVEWIHMRMQVLRKGVLVIIVRIRLDFRL